jgi:hypothetical protein
MTPRTGDPRRAQSEVVVGRRYLDHGFIDAAMRIFSRHAAQVTASDWNALVDRLLERGRIVDVVQACQMGDVPLPRERLLQLGDQQLRRKDVQGAIRFFELAAADHARWSGLLDVLTRLPGFELTAVEIAERHLGTYQEPAPTPLLAASA